MPPPQPNLTKRIVYHHRRLRIRMNRMKRITCILCLWPLDLKQLGDCYPIIAGKKNIVGDRTQVSDSPIIVTWIETLTQSPSHWDKIIRVFLRKAGHGMEPYAGIEPNSSRRRKVGHGMEPYAGIEPNSFSDRKAGHGIEPYAGIEPNSSSDRKAGHGIEP